MKYIIFASLMLIGCGYGPAEVKLAKESCKERGLYVEWTINPSGDIVKHKCVSK